MGQRITWDGIWRWDAPGLTWDGIVPNSRNNMENRVSASIAPADKTAITAAIATIRGKLPFLINLTDDERKSILKLGDKSIAFEEKCFNYMTAHPELVPGFIDM